MLLGDNCPVRCGAEILHLHSELGFTGQRDP